MTRLAPAARAAVRRADGDVAQAVASSLEAVAFRSAVRGSDTVFVKPNYTFPRPVPGVTTSPIVLEAVLGRLKDRAARVLVGESDGGYASFTAEDSFEKHDLASICKRTGAEMLNLSRDDPVTVEDVVLGRKVAVRLSRRALHEIDVGVSVPVMKAHAIHRISLSLKNLWGCDTDTMRLLRRKHLSRRVALIARSMKMRLAVIDSTTALDRYGPMEGDAVDLGLVVAADNLVAADAVGARLMGYDPRRLEMIRTAHRAGLGPIAAEEVSLDWSGPTPVRRFRLERRAKDYLAIMTFHSSTLSKLVYDSRLTPWIYRSLGKVPKRKLT